MFGVIGALLTLAFLGDTEGVSRDAENSLKKFLQMSHLLRADRYTFFVVFTRDLRQEWELLRHDERVRWRAGYEERLNDLANAGLMDEQDALFEEMVEDVHWLDAVPDEQMATVVDQMRADFERTTKDQRSDWVDRYDPQYRWIVAWIPPDGFPRGVPGQGIMAENYYYTAAAISVAKQPGWEDEADQQLTEHLETLLDDVRMSVNSMVFTVARPGQSAPGLDPGLLIELESRALLGLSNAEEWSDHKLAGDGNSWLRVRELWALKRWLHLIALSKGRWTDPEDFVPRASLADT